MDLTSGLPETFIKSTISNIEYWQNKANNIELPWLIRRQELHLIAALSFGLTIQESLPGAIRLLEMLLPELRFSLVPDQWINITEMLEINENLPAAVSSQFEINLAIAKANMLMAGDQARQAKEGFLPLVQAFFRHPHHPEHFLAILTLAKTYLLMNDTENFSITLEKLNEFNLEISAISNLHFELAKLNFINLYLAGKVQDARNELPNLKQLSVAKTNSVLAAEIFIALALFYLHNDDPTQALKRLSRATTILSSLPVLYSEWARIELLRSIAHAKLGEKNISLAFLKKANNILASLLDSRKFRNAVDHILLNNKIN